MIKLIIFDIGGTLIKTDDAIISSIEKVFRNNKIKPGSKKKMISVFGTSLYDYIKNYLPENIKNKTQTTNFCYKEFKKIYPSKAKHLMKVFPKVDSTLTSLHKKGIKIAILSCMVRDEVKVNLSLLKFNKFGAVFSLEDYGKKRPRPNGLFRIAKIMKIKPKDIAYVGDTVNDVLMAKNAKMTSIAVLTGVQKKSMLKKVNPDYLLNGVNKITNIKEIQKK